jgi:hypothetical protein
MLAGILVGEKLEQSGNADKNINQAGETGRNVVAYSDTEELESPVQTSYYEEYPSDHVQCFHLDLIIILLMS